MAADLVGTEEVATGLADLSLVAVVTGLIAALAGRGFLATGGVLALDLDETAFWGSVLEEETTFFPMTFLAMTFFAGVFLAGVFLAATFLAGAFLAATFLATGF